MCKNINSVAAEFEAMDKDISKELQILILSANLITIKRINK